MENQIIIPKIEVSYQPINKMFGATIKQGNLVIHNVGVDRLLTIVKTVNDYVKGLEIKA